MKTDYGEAIHMKRMKLVLDEQLLEEVRLLSGERTYSRAVTRAIEDYLRRHKQGAFSILRERGFGKETSPR